MLDLIEQQKRKWSLPSHVRVVVSYEAGQDGFWILRSLRSRGIDSWVRAIGQPAEGGIQDDHRLAHAAWRLQPGKEAPVRIASRPASFLPTASVGSGLMEGAQKQATHPCLRVVLIAVRKRQSHGRRLGAGLQQHPLAKSHRPVGHVPG